MSFPLQRVLLLLFLNVCWTASTLATCPPPANPIEAENCLPGSPQSQWAVVDGASDLLGFATDISVNAGQTIYFKISTSAPAFSITIYRLGYYQGLGARFIATLPPPSPQQQPACLSDSSTGLNDCGNWTVSSSWTPPASAVSGIYLARLFRADTGEASPIIFVVRNDSSHSSLYLETSDETWQAYNDYGGNSLYGASGNEEGNTADRAYKVSYNRPTNYDSFFNSEYPMVRWLEANGYDVSYAGEVDADRNGALIQQHHIFLSVGHDEYWSGGQRTNVEAARAGGVNLAFFSGNEIFWKTRWEASIDGSGTAYRTLVCYKESLAGAVIDPADPPTWTGMWRDPRFSPPADGGRPENALSGTLPWVSSPRNDSITVPQADGRMRFWRNTSVATQAPGQVATMPAGTLGVEWDADVDNGFRPAGLIPLSTITLTVPTCILGYTTIGNCTATHHLSLYRASSGALVFGAGTEQWSWGLDPVNGGGVPSDVRMQQATVNLLGDMGAQPATLQSGLVAATASNDHTPPVSVITSPASGTTVVAHNPVTVTGTAADSDGGVVGAVEISTDGGNTWHPAQGRENWSYTFVPATSSAVNILSRSVDDSGNLETPSSNITLAVNPPVCPCTIWPSNAVPNVPDAGAYSPLELGVQFRSDTGGYITGIRFYKSSANIGPHIANLWSSSGSLLASATFTSESASGWQQVNFAVPVAITANTFYVASYHTTVGHFSEDETYFLYSGVDNSPLHAPMDSAGSPNGVYAFTASSIFPTNDYYGTNFWVDVVFSTTAGGPQPLSIGTTSLPGATQSAPYSQNLSASGGTPPYSWQLSSGSLPAGITLSQAGQLSGTPSALGTSNFSVKVTDSSSPAKTASQPLSITSVGQSQPQGSTQLNGTYAFSFSGMRGSGGNASAFAAVGRFTADGAGNFVNGLIDTNGVTSGTALSAQPLSGTYSIGADNRGTMIWNVSGYSLKFSIALNAAGNAQFVEMDASGGSGIIGSGTLEKVDTSAYNTAQIAGDYAFGFSGLDALNERVAIIGRFTADGSGSFNNPAGDLDAYGTIASMSFTSATYGVTDSSNGRGSINFAFSFGGTPANLNFVFYIVSANKLFLMERDNTSSATPLVVGALLRQQTPAGGFSTTSLNANSVISLTGQSLCGSTVPVPKTVVGLLTADSNGGFTLTYDENYCSAPNSVTGASGSYAVSANGRAVLSVGGYTLVAYLVAQNQYFLLVADSNALFGLSQPQSAQSLSNSSLNGPYAGFTVTPATFDATTFSGEFSANGASPTGNLTGTQDVSTSSSPSPAVSFSATYSVSATPANGRGTMTVTAGTGGTVVLYMISPSQFVAISQTDPRPAVLFFDRGPAATPAPTLSSVTLNPTTVVGGAQSSTGTVTLSGPAPNGGLVVNLSSSNTNAASTPTNVTVPVEATSVTFLVTTNAVAAPTTVVISASSGTVTQKANLSVAPAPSFALSASPDSLSIVQGTSGASTITVNPLNGFNSGVSLSASGLPAGANASFSPNPATAASTLTITAGSSAATGTFAVTITGTSGSLQVTTVLNLTVVPLPTVSSLALNPSSVVGGLASSTGTVTLSGPAPSGGVLIHLSSNNGAAQVPSTILVPQGAKGASFTISTSIVLISTSATISASFNGATRTATLTLLL